MRRYGSFFPLARLTCVEIPRQPALLLLTTTLVLFIACLPFLITHSLGEPGKLVRDSGMAVMFLGGLLVSVPAACNAMSSEIRKGTAGAVLSKPVSRGCFLTAKFFGVAAVMLVFSGMATIAILLADQATAVEYHIGWRYLIPLYLAVALSFVFAGCLNFLSRRPFTSTAFWAMSIFTLLALGWTLIMPEPTPTGSEFVLKTVPVRWALIQACALIALAALMLQSLALLCALRLGIVPSLSVCSGFFLLGLVADYLLAVRAGHAVWAKCIYWVLPNWQHFWMADALSKGGQIPWAYVGQAAVYAAAWTAGILLISLGIFDRMEVS